MGLAADLAAPFQTISLPCGWRQGAICAPVESVRGLSCSAKELHQVHQNSRWWCRASWLHVQPKGELEINAGRLQQRGHSLRCEMVRPCRHVGHLLGKDGQSIEGVAARAHLQVPLAKVEHRGRALWPVPLNHWGAVTPFRLLRPELDAGVDTPSSPRRSSPEGGSFGRSTGVGARPSSCSSKPRISRM